MTPPEVKVSIAEVCEVRGYGLNAPELLSLAVSASDRLPPCPKGVVFDADNVFINNKGAVEIKSVASSSVAREFVPPEWAKGEEDPQAAAVYCLGAVLRAAGAEEASDVDLFSLVNILTVAMTGTRPTAHRMGQMAKNQLRGRDPASMLMCVYEELMGDEDENRLDDDMMDFDDVDEILSTDGSHMRDDLHQMPTVVKRATDYYEDDKEMRAGASTSTSSGNSTQKDSSPFGFFEDDGHNKGVEASPSSSKVDSTKPRAPTPEVPSHFEETTIVGITSPPPAFNETFIEEKTVDLSFNRSSEFEDNFVEHKSPTQTTQPTPSTVVVPPTPTEQLPSNPFDDDDNDEFHGGTLSGRDPFDDEASEGKAKHRKYVQNKKAALVHRFSSSSEEIVEAHVDDEDYFVPKPKVKKAETYFEEDVEDLVPHHQYASPPSHSRLTPFEEAQQALRANRNRPPTASNGVVHQKMAEFPQYDEVPQAPSRQRHPASADRTKALVKEFSYDDSDEEIEEALTKSTAPTKHQTPVEAVVITERRSVVPPPIAKKPERRVEPSAQKDDEEDIDEIFSQFKKEKPKSTPVLVEAREASIAASTAERISQDVSPSPFLSRRNSLAPSRISGRKSTRSMRGKRKTRAMPEFYDLSRYSSIRLRAPLSKKKKMSLHRVDDTEVTVELLNGQKVEVSCRSDVVARDIFFLVVQHMNINEHVFFGLSFFRDGEHFFVEDHQRLEKFAPSGWKSVNRTGARVPYVLHLRFRFYPQILEFIKTDVTMHELYLQCRRDVLEERIQPKRDAAFELAAIALQAEFGNRPPPVIADYFDCQHYLPKRFCSHEDPRRLQSLLAELHGHYGGTRRDEAEQKYIQLCQRHSDFGCHLHRVFRSKPTMTHGASPFDPDTGSSLWVGIMPRGICIFEEQGGVRELVTEHLWPQTQTLQFDKKRFVIVALGLTEEQLESTFYTDHHTKSSYFVKFAATQHRFMMKMRQWKSTLRFENTMQSMPDVCVEGRIIPPAPIRPSLEDSPPQSPLDAASSLFAKMPAEAANGGRPSTLPPPAPPTAVQQQYDSVDECAVDSLVENFERFTRGEPNEQTPRGMQFDVVLLKEINGLGLTLVDGNLNGVPGVYVKIVADNGAGMKAGLCVGDRLVRVGGESLDGRDRHRAVELVARCGAEVPLTVARLDGIIRHDRGVSHENPKKHSSASVAAAESLAAPNVNSQKGVSRTPPPPRKAANRRQRAVSDFGAIGDNLPTLDGDNLINIKAISGLHLDDSDDEKGEYRLPTTSMYAFDREDDLPVSAKMPKKLAVEESRSTQPDGRKYRYARRSNLDWADELEEVGEEAEDDERLTPAVIEVELRRNENGSLGVQIASLAGRVCIKKLTDEPALSHPDISVGDLLLYVNGASVKGKSHQDVVAMLRGGGETVTLGVQRPPPGTTNGKSDTRCEAQIISVMLQKKPQGSLGLSLAKRTMSDGIFIRSIAEGSAAALDGTLRVGDRLVSLDGEDVDGLTPSAIHDRLKSVQGPVAVTICRGHADK